MMKLRWTKKESTLNDIIFQGRNQAYGAYDLRVHSDTMLTKSLFMGVALFTGFAMIPLVINKMSPKGGETTIVNVERVRPLEIVNIDVVERQPAPISQQVQHNHVKTVDTQVPTPTREAKIEAQSTTIKESEGAIRGLSNTEGEDRTHINLPDIVTPKIEVGNGPINKTHEWTKKEDNSEIVLNVDESADFVGGINLFREKVMQNFDVSHFEGSGDVLKATVTFVVEKNGSISNIKVEGKDVQFNKETEQVIKRIGGQWRPAKVYGQLVRSYFRFPVSMRFE